MTTAAPWLLSRIEGDPNTFPNFLTEEQHASVEAQSPGASNSADAALQALQVLVNSNQYGDRTQQYQATISGYGTTSVTINLMSVPANIPVPV